MLDVAFGDVLLCSGQSNQEYPLSHIVNGSAVLAESDALGSGIRVMRLDHLSSPNTTMDQLSWGRSWDGQGSCTDRCGHVWGRMGSKAWSSFSAVCYLTGRKKR